MHKLAAGPILIHRLSGLESARKLPELCDIGPLDRLHVELSMLSAKERGKRARRSLRHGGNQASGAWQRG